MALAVASFTKAQKASGDGSSPVTLTLPSSLTTGDLLVFSVLGNGSSQPAFYGPAGSRTFDPPESVTTSGITVPTGFTRAGGHNYRQGQGSIITSFGAEAVFYKVVDGTETNYTFTQSGYYSFIHITGWNGESVNPMFDTVHSQVGTPYATPTTQPFPLTRTSAGLLIMQGSAPNDTNDASSPVITTTGTNPSWTEIYSFSNFGISDESGFCFYAVSAEDDDITAFTTNNTTPGRALYYIAEPSADTAPESTQLPITATAVVSTGSSANTAMSTQLPITATVLPNKGKGQAETTLWRNPDKPTTNWNNLPK